jgi:4-amino-4-deoxy-L-arabinose transferase-like glycosyltransferase
VTRPDRVGLALVLLVYLALATAYAFVTPPWNNPDEPAHYNYVAFVAERHAFPELVAGDWDQDLLNGAIPERFHPRFDVSSIRYESHQPPLYYLLSAPVYSATSSLSLRARVLALRAVSIVLGLGLGIAAYAIARTVVPQYPEAAPLASAISLLIPMSTAAGASINNDMLSMALAAVATVVLVRWAESSGKGPTKSPGGAASIAIGLLVGLILLTKLTVYLFAVMLCGAAILSTLRAKDAQLRAAYIRHTALGLSVALLVAGWWFVRSAGVYGWDDLLAQRRHDAVVVGQARYADFGPDNWFYLAVTVFHSFFAQFGWMTIVVDNLTYGLYGAFLVLALVGVWLCRSEVSAPIMWTLTAITVAVYGQLLYYNLSFIQAQGRYLFPGLGAISCLLSLGWSRIGRSQLGANGVLVWISLAVATAVGGIGNWDVGLLSGGVFVLTLVAARWGYLRMAGHTQRATCYLAATTTASLAALNLMCLARYIVPFYRG